VRHAAEIAVERGDGPAPYQGGDSDFQVSPPDVRAGAQQPAPHFSPASRLVEPERNDREQADRALGALQPVGIDRVVAV
jgi:hypothetical protein